MSHRAKWLLAIAGTFMLVYAVAVLIFVATSPDVRLRALLVDAELPVKSVRAAASDQADQSDPSQESGILIRSTPGLEYNGPRGPEPGDLLLKVNGRRMETFMDFTREMVHLRNAEIPPGGWLYPGADQSELVEVSEYSLPTLTAEINVGRRWVEVEYLSAKANEKHRSWLLVQSLPLGEVLLSLVWFLLHVAVFAVAAVAYWQRPFDHSFRLFFVMCIVTLGAFVGGYHWWVISPILWLSVPFAVSIMLVPPISLHFFLAFPRPKAFLAKHPQATLAALYALPVTAIAAILSMLVYSNILYGNEQLADRAATIRQVLGTLSGTVWAYESLAGVYFVVMLLVLRHSYVQSHNPVERGPLALLWRAGLVSAALFGFSLYLALAHPVEFELGAARIPLFFASLSFLLAYSIGVLRYKLMLVDQVVSKGFLYYLVSCVLTASFGILAALGMLVPQILNISLSSQQALLVAFVLIMFVLLLLWIRDRFQQMVDRQFFREKYQLDKALKRMNRAVGHLSDPEALAQMMLGSCRDVLGVERVALYLRTSNDEPFHLIAALHAENVPMQLAAERELIEALRDGGSLQRVTPDTRSEMSPHQELMRRLGCHLIHPLEVEWGIGGLVVLGEKSSGPFTAENLTFLNALGQITNVALYSARVEQETSRLNEELRLKIETIVDQGRQIAILQADLASGQSTTDIKTVKKPAEEFRRDAITGNSPAIRRVLDTVRKVAVSESSVLIRGESGTGKEVLAQVLHDNSPRRTGPMIGVHCAALSPSLLESELFGHAKGSFTGAHRDKVGRFEMATGGTLFLDEIGDISLETQIKLLRVLQERSFEPVGGTRTIHVDVRLVTATHQDLERLIAAGRFREDLYYRLNVISITLPPLRERMDDIYELSFHFLKQATQRLSKQVSDIDRSAFAALERHAWPGNIRELENVIERAVVLAEGNRITLKNLPAEVLQPRAIAPQRGGQQQPAVSMAAYSAARNRREADVSDSLDSATERRMLIEALRLCEGNKAEAARSLGMPRSTYFSKLKKYGIRDDNWRELEI